LEARIVPAPHVIVIGGGLAGLSASVALADAGFRISLFEKGPRLGGRATSYILPSGEHIDNCQHVTLRCCTNLEDFYSRIGVGDKVRFHDSLLFSDSSGRRAHLRASGLPAPLHFLPSFARFPLLNWKDKRGIARAMLHILASRGRSKLAGGMSMLDFLRKQHQTQRAIDRFWRTVLVSALNEELERIDSSYGIAVFWKAFLSNSIGFVVGIPSIPLADLYASSGERIGQNGGQVFTRCGVAEIQLSQSVASGVRLDNGKISNADYYVSALTFDRLLNILPENARAQEPFSRLHNLGVSPITGVHLWFDRKVISEPFVTSVDQTIQWVFNKTLLCGPESAETGQYLQIVISASHNLAQQTQQEIVALCVKELGGLIPLVRDAKLIRSVVIREKAATFSPEPGCDVWRPGSKTSIPNLVLAGDWIQTGWPATMESAVRSGYQAAETIIAMEGRPASILRPELPTTGLVRWIARG
jgi:squalene-associated FAD-dependent desaturase